MNPRVEFPEMTKSTASSVWFLVGQMGDGESVCVPLTASPFSIGRRHDASLCLPMRTVSSNHAEIHFDDQQVRIRDLGSTNGSYVNGVRIEGEFVLERDDLLQFADVALRLRRQRTEREDAHTLAEDVCDQALALVQLDKLLNERAVIPYYQPIVDIPSRKVMGHEVLGRSRLVGVETPGAMFRAAAKLNLEVQLSTMLRWEGVKQSDEFAVTPHLFINTHPLEIKAGDFLQSMRATRDAHPDLPLTVEIHEGAVTDVAAMIRIREALQDMNIGLAYDDFGAGQARLVELVEAKPDYLKFDISLVRGLDKASEKHQQLVSSLVQIALDLGVVPLAEGIETPGQSDACEQLGFALGQGFFYGKPAPAFCK